MKDPSKSDEPGTAEASLRATLAKNILALLERRADLRERLGHIDITERISQAKHLRIEAEKTGNMPGKAADRH